jgi:hypothetical protein
MSSNRKNQRAVDVYRRMKDTQRLIEDELRSRGIEPDTARANNYRTPTTLENVGDANIVDISWDARAEHLPTAPIQVNYYNPPPEKKPASGGDYAVVCFLSAFLGIGGFFAFYGIVSLMARMFRGW